MGYITIVTAIFLLAILAGCYGIKGNNTPKGSTAGAPAIAEAKSSQRNDIQQRLQKLANSKARKIKNVEAVCYITILETKCYEYICPKCGEKSIFPKNEGFDQEFSACRRAVKNIKEIHVELDESKFCIKCSPDYSDRSFVLLIYYEGEKEPYRAKGIGLESLVLIKEFLSGSRNHTDEFGVVTPLKYYVKRLSELLGVEIELFEKESK
jgi:hypothetical protein